MFEPPRLLEHVLAKNAVEQSGGGDRTDMVETTCSDRLGEGQRVRHALDVRLDDFRRFGGEIVDGGEMEEMVDLALKPAGILRRDPEIGLRDVAGD